MIRKSIVPLALMLAAALQADVSLHFKSKFTSAMPLPQAASQAIPVEIVIRVSGDRSYTSAGAHTSITDVTSGRVTVLDPAGKRYATVTFSDYVKALKGMMPAGGVPTAAQQTLDQMQVKTTARVTGNSETIAGIDCEEHEVVASMTMPNPAMPNGMAMELRVSQWIPKPAEVARVPALTELDAFYRRSKAAGFDASAMMHQMFGALPGFGDKLAGLTEALQANGNLQMRMRMSLTLPGMAALMEQAQKSGKGVPGMAGGPLFEMTMEVDKLDTGSIPASVFQVPDGYQSAPLDDLMKSFIPSTKPAIQ